MAIRGSSGSFGKSGEPRLSGQFRPSRGGGARISPGTASPEASRKLRADRVKRTASAISRKRRAMRSSAQRRVGRHSINPLAAELMAELSWLAASELAAQVVLLTLLARRLRLASGLALPGAISPATPKEPELTPEMLPRGAGIAGGGSAGAAIGNTTIRSTTPNAARKQWRYCS